MANSNISNESPIETDETPQKEKIYDGVKLGILAENGHIRRATVDSFCRLEISPSTNYKTYVNIYKGLQLIGSIEVKKEVEMAKIGSRGLILTGINETYIFKFPKVKDSSDFKESVKETLAQNVDSIFNQRTDATSAEQYFQFYGYLSQQQNMMQDFVRTSTYQRAMLENRADFHDKVVLDVGAGSGILSFFAVQAGAKKVYAVEASSMAEHCQCLVDNNLLSDHVIVMSGKIEEIELPEMVDIVVSEPMGYMLFNERMLETFLHAKKWLKPNGKMYPSQGDLHIAPFSDDALYMEQFSKANFWQQPSFHGVDLTSLRDAAVAEYFRQPVVDTFDIRICLAPTFKYTVDFESAFESDLHDIKIPVTFKMQQSGTIHGLAFWFDVAFIGSQSVVWLSTGPTQPLTHWYQVRCLLLTPVFARQGQTLTGCVHLRSNTRQSYDVDIELSVDGTDIKSSNTLDLKNPCFRYTGQQVLPPPGSNRISPTDAYYDQVDSTTNCSLEQISTDSFGMPMLNGGSTNEALEQYVQQAAPSGVVYNNYLSLASFAGINPGSIPAPAIVNSVGSIQNHFSSVASSSGFVIEPNSQMVGPSASGTTDFPLSSHLMIGDYMVPSNVLLPSAQHGVNIVHYKTSTDGGGDL